MSPKARTGSEKQANSNIYTVILALAFAIVLAASALVAYKCYFQYGTIFQIQ